MWNFRRRAGLEEEAGGRPLPLGGQLLFWPQRSQRHRCLHAPHRLATTLQDILDRTAMTGWHPVCEPAQTGRAVTPDDLGRLGHDRDGLRGVSSVAPERPEESPCNLMSSIIVPRSSVMTFSFPVVVCLACARTARERIRHRNPLQAKLLRSGLVERSS